MKESPENLNKKWELPANLKLTGARRLSAEAEQKRWAQNSPFASVSGEEVERNRAAIYIRDLEQALKDVESDETVSEFERTETIAGINTKLAESYAILGRFDKAYALERDEVKRNEYRAILEAVARDDAEWCDCPQQGGDTPPTNTFVKQEIFSHKHGRVMPVLACRGCGMMNVAPMPREQAKMREARRQAIAIVGNQSLEDAKRLLLSRKHTTREIVK